MVINYDLPFSMASLLKITEREHYALVLATALAAAHQSGKKTTLTEIARWGGLSHGYIEEVAAALRHGRLIRGRRGRGGGYRLTRPPVKITMAQILRALDNSPEPLTCLSRASACPHSRECHSRRLLARVDKNLDKILNQVTLAEAAGSSK